MPGMSPRSAPRSWIAASSREAAPLKARSGGGSSRNRKPVTDGTGCPQRGSRRPAGEVAGQAGNRVASRGRRWNDGGQEGRRAASAVHRDRPCGRLVPPHEPEGRRCRRPDAPSAARSGSPEHREQQFGQDCSEPDRPIAPRRESSAARCSLRTMARHRRRLRSARRERAPLRPGHRNPGTPNRVRIPRVSLSSLALWPRLHARKLLPRAVSASGCLAPTAASRRRW